MQTQHIPVGDPVDRAFAAYFRTEGATANQPADTSGVRKADDRQYVVLENGNGTLAVYRILGSGALKRLKRWPAELVDD